MGDNQDFALGQLIYYSSTVENDPGPATTDAGNLLPSLTASLTVGEHGPVLLQDAALLDALFHFNHERIPERVVHAKGGGAFGTFKVTHDISRYTTAKIFSKIGKKTPMAARFTTVAGNLGSQDTVRDVRGFALKFYTEDGIWDLVGNNTPIFFVRDPMLFTHFIRTQKRNPSSNVRDWNAHWDFFSLRPETVLQFLILYSDRGIPDGFRFQNGYGSHTFSFINKNGLTTFVKFHMKPKQGIRNLTPKKALEIAGSDPDYSVRDLYNSIANGDFPSWTMYVQLMSQEEAKTTIYNPFDLTKVWSQKDYPLIPVGEFTLNRNPTNFFAEIEQLAFNPANMVPGIGTSPDKMLHARMFAYKDTQMYRLGKNHNQLPVNCPYRRKNYERDGRATIDNQGGAPNYHPNSFKGVYVDKFASKLHPDSSSSGHLIRFDTGDEDNYTQARDFYLNVLDEDAKKRLAENIAGDLRRACGDIQERVVRVFGNVDTSLARNIMFNLKATAEADI